MEIGVNGTIGVLLLIEIMLVYVFKGLYVGLWLDSDQWNEVSCIGSVTKLRRRRILCNQHQEHISR